MNRNPFINPLSICLDQYDLFICCRIGLSGAEILKSALFYSESLKYLNLSHCKLNDVAGAIVAKALISNEVCEVWYCGVYYKEHDGRR